MGRAGIIVMWEGYYDNYNSGWELGGRVSGWELGGRVSGWELGGRVSGWELGGRVSGWELGGRVEDNYLFSLLCTCTCRYVYKGLNTSVTNVRVAERNSILQYSIKRRKEKY